MRTVEQIELEIKIWKPIGNIYILKRLKKELADLLGKDLKSYKAKNKLSLELKLEEIKKKEEKKVIVAPSRRKLLKSLNSKLEEEGFFETVGKKVDVAFKKQKKKRRVKIQNNGMLK